MGILDSDLIDCIPSEHAGVEYRLFSSDLSKKRLTKRYLEIGVENGLHFSTIYAEHAIGVDPCFKISANIASHKNSIELFQIPSDDFFSFYRSTLSEVTRPDLVFLDGLHVFEFLLRDFFNAERICKTNGLIMMHDCLPLNEEMADRDEQRAHYRGQGTKYLNFWTGDVWKIVPILKKYRPDLRIICVDCPPTGLVCVTNLNPNSMTLSDLYLDIVEEFREITNNSQSLASMYNEMRIISSREILRSNDHSLFFRM